MRFRLAAVLLLATLSIAVRLTSIELRYLSTELSSAPPFGTRVAGRYLIVDRVQPAADCYRGWSDPGRPKPGDRVQAVYDHRGGGGRVHGLFDYGLYLRPINTEESWTLEVERLEPDGPRRLSLAMPPSVPITWSAGEWISSLAVDFYLPFLATMTGLLIGVLRWRDRQAWRASLLFLALGLAIVPSLSQFPPGWRLVALFLQDTAARLLPFLVVAFFLEFPSASPIQRRVPWLKRVFAAITVLSWIAGLVYDFSKHLSLASTAAIDSALGSLGVSAGLLDSVFTAAAGLMLFTAVVSILLNAREAQSRDERRRLRIVAVGVVAGLLPAILMFGAASTGTKLPMGVLVPAIPLVGLFPLSFAYVVVRHRVFGVRVILRRGLTYALVSRGFLIAEAALIFLALLGVAGTVLRRLQPEVSGAASTAGTAVATFMLTLGMRRVNRRVLPVIDRRFFRDAYDGRKVLQDLSRAVRRMASQPERLLSHASAEIEAALHPRGLGIYVAADACDRLQPVDPTPQGCCDLEVGSGARRRFFLCMKGANEPSADEGSGRSSRMYTVRTPLGAHLGACATGEPDVLEVEAFEPVLPGAADWPRFERGQSRVGLAAAASCAEEGAVLARFDTRLVVPLVTAGRVLGFLVLGEKRSEEPYSREDKELLLTVAEQVAIALDYAQLIGQAVEQAALRREIQIAQDVQQQLFPHERPPLRSLRYAGVCRAARGVGGDFFDFLPLSGDQLGLALADIAGKGLPAALLMASLQALLRSHAPTHTAALEELARELNRHLVETSDGARFATLFFGVFDDRTRRLRYVNAGHLPPLVIGWEPDGTPAVRRLESGGMVLGLFPGQSYQSGCAALRPGERLLIFSDGVTEAADGTDEMFGEHRLVAAAAAFDGDVEDLPAHILGEVERFVGPSAQQDDITVIAAEVM